MHIEWIIQWLTTCVMLCLQKESERMNQQTGLFDKWNQMIQITGMNQILKFRLSGLMESVWQFTDTQAGSGLVWSGLVLPLSLFNAVWAMIVRHTVIIYWSSDACPTRPTRCCCCWMRIVGNHIIASFTNRKETHSISLPLFIIGLQILLFSFCKTNLKENGKKRLN